MVRLHSEPRDEPSRSASSCRCQLGQRRRSQIKLRRHSHVARVRRAHIIKGADAAEAELYAITSGAKEGLFLRGVLEVSGLTKTGHAHIRTAAKAALDLLHRTGGAGKLRHVSVRYFFVRNLMKESKVKVTKVSTRENPSDNLTKFAPSQVLGNMSRLLPAGVGSRTMSAGQIQTIATCKRKARRLGAGRHTAMGADFR